MEVVVVPFGAVLSSPRPWRWWVVIIIPGNRAQKALRGKSRGTDCVGGGIPGEFGGNYLSGGTAEGTAENSLIIP